MAALAVARTLIITQKAEKLAVAEAATNKIVVLLVQQTPAVAVVAVEMAAPPALTMTLTAMAAVPEALGTSASGCTLNPPRKEGLCNTVL